MKKLFIIGLVGLTLLGVGCGSNKAKIEAPKEEKVVEQPSVKEDKEVDTPIVVESDDDSIYEGKADDKPRVHPEDDISYTLNLQTPDSIGNVYGIMTYTNNSDYPITGFEVTMLDNTTNETYYYMCYETVMPGETSPNFESFGSSDMTPIAMEYTIFDPETMLGCHYEADLKLRIVDWTEWSTIWAD